MVISRRMLLGRIGLGVVLAMGLAGRLHAGLVKVVADLDYLPDRSHADDKDKLDLYLPEGVTGFPVVVVVHGGALTDGKKEGSAHVGRTLAAGGIGAAVINYRLSPKEAAAPPFVTHPAHVEDLAAAFAWVKAHAAEHGGDPGAVFLLGHSAGAYLVSLLTLDARYLAAHKLDARAIRGTVPVSAFFYVERVAGDRPKTVWGQDPEKWPAASPARYVRKDVPPQLLLYADGDDAWRRAQNEEMGKALGGAGVDVTVRQIDGRDHGSIWRRIGEDDEVTRLVRAFVARLTAKR